MDRHIRAKAGSKNRKRPDVSAEVEHSRPGRKTLQQPGRVFPRHADDHGLIDVGRVRPAAKLHPVAQLQDAFSWRQPPELILDHRPRLPDAGADGQVSADLVPGIYCESHGTVTTISAPTTSSTI